MTDYPTDSRGRPLCPRCRQSADIRTVRTGSTVSATMCCSCGLSGATVERPLKSPHAQNLAVYAAMKDWIIRAAATWHRLADEGRPETLAEITI